MDIFVYSDESGVFDVLHNDWFTFGGLIFLSKQSRNDAARQYIHAERCLSLPDSFDRALELKAANLDNKSKGKLFRSLNSVYRFGCVINQRQILRQIFQSKKSKQRYLDYAYKIAVKRAFQKMIRDTIIKAEDINLMFFFVDEHSTATNGKYELQEGLEQEFKYGTYNQNYSAFYPPIFPYLSGVKVQFCNSSVKPLIRAADITANKLFHLAIMNDDISISRKFYSVEYFPFSR